MRRDRSCSVSGGFLLLLLLVVPLHAQTPIAGQNKVLIRGQEQEVYYYPAMGTRLNRKVLRARRRRLARLGDYRGTNDDIVGL